jgi:hypothetical protein
MVRHLLVIAALASLAVVPLFGQEAAGGSDTGDLAKAAQNPVGDLISLPFQNNTTFDVGPADRTQNVLNIQPVWPLSLSKKWNLITRTIIPVISQPAPGSDRINGLGDVNFTGFISPSEPGKWIWGVGPALVFPTATDDVLGTGKWSLGPSVVLLTMPGPWVLGSLLSNTWSVAGDSDRADVNQFLWQYFINYNYPSGFYWTSAPIITANWEAASGQQWTVPFGGGFGKLFKIGRRPVNASIQGFYNVEKPDSGGDWSLRIQVQLLFPK